MRSVLSALGLLLFASPAPARAATTPLFADDALISLVVRGPIEAIPKGAQAGSLALQDGSETLNVTLEPRGITRRQRDVCQFPPIRVGFGVPPPATSLFAGQRRLKLVTHCRAGEGFQNFVLLEYAAYRLYNVLTPLSFRARLAQIAYRDPAGQPIVTRYGFFIEDIDDVARRNAMQAPRLGERFPVTRLSPPDAARFAVFQYMIGNLDWAMQAGPAGDNCCHNSRPLSRDGANQIAPVPYDFDFSGLVGAPYATPPSSVPVSNVRQRRYRGLCRHNAEARSAFAEFRAKAPALRQVIADLSGLEQAARNRALAYLDSFFRDIATDALAESRLLRTCLG